MQITNNHIVTVEYTLKNAAGEVLDSSDGGEPLSYLHGAEEIVPGLERELEGLSVGDEKDVRVQPEDGYGLPDPDGIFAVPRSVFPGDQELAPGDTLIGEDNEGHQLPVRIVEVIGDTVRIDANHPLAGEVLHYHIKVCSVRAATEEELEHGHSHDGEDGDHGHGDDDDHHAH